MEALLFDLLEISVVVSVLVCLLYPIKGMLRARYGAGVMKCLWFVLVIRMLVIYNPSVRQEEKLLLEFERPERKTNAVAASMMPTLSEIDEGKYGEAISNQTAEQEDLSIWTGLQKKLWNVEGLLHLWVAGMVIKAFYLMLCYLVAMRHIRANAVKLTDTRVLQVLEGLNKEYRVRGSLQAYQCSRMPGPALLGVWKHRLFIPEFALGWKEKELELVLRHEFCHIRKKDCLLKIVVNTLCCVYWFLPAAYIIRREFLVNMELQCDDLALVGGKERDAEIYAELLMELAGRKRQNAFILNFENGKKSLKGRLSYLLKGTKKKNGLIVMIGVLLAVMLAGAFSTCGYRTEKVWVMEKQVLFQTDK